MKCSAAVPGTQTVMLHTNSKSRAGATEAHFKALNYTVSRLFVLYHIWQEQAPTSVVPTSTDTVRSTALSLHLRDNGVDPHQ